MKVHKDRANKNEYVWYTYDGYPSTKPYDHKDKIKNRVFFIGQGVLYYAYLLDIIPGPTHGGNRLIETEKEHMGYPEDFEEQEGIAYFIKCKNIIKLDYDKAEKNILYDINRKQYILSRAPNPVCYVYFKGPYVLHTDQTTNTN
jgi:hypothetical protein